VRRDIWELVSPGKNAQQRERRRSGKEMQGQRSRIPNDSKDDAENRVGRGGEHTAMDGIASTASRSTGVPNE
jgi:hypothetical protein